MRFPEPRAPLDIDAPYFDIDLPTQPSDRFSHIRFRLAQTRACEASPCWAFHIPPQLVPDHNEISSARASLLSVAMMQISGAVMSLAEDITQNFEEATRLS